LALTLLLALIAVAADARSSTSRLPALMLRGGTHDHESSSAPLTKIAVPQPQTQSQPIAQASRTILICASIFVIWLGAATIIFAVSEGWPLSQALFYAVDTGMSIGFGAVAEQHTRTKVFTVLHVLLGASAAGGAIALFAEAVVKNQGGLAAAEYSNAALAAAFAAADTSGDGSICKEELDQVLRNIGIGLAPDELRDAMQAFDHNADGNIDHAEFVGAVRPHLEGAASLETALKAAIIRRTESPTVRFARQAWSYLVSQRVLLLWIFWVGTGTLWAMYSEGLDVITSIYFAIGGLSTGGLQAPALTADGTLPTGAAVFVALFCLTGVPIFGFALGRFADLFVTRLLAARERRALRRPITDDEFTFAEGLFCPDEHVELAEFLALELIRLGKVDYALLEAIQREFTRLDADGNGQLTRSEVKRALLLPDEPTEV